ncbi:MAG: NAD(P)-dependent alcohol dehydrogenase [Candidatus Omnitrophica bacterium]|nr:NAD(P)-dependent alcohol dehydrogenase [Candidatus Omnitrophota bacterium]MCM8802092.1 NAD(P)-dependent alcohol dehydrogenase [Candidatus Omnitrophota bacterium]
MKAAFLTRPYNIEIREIEKPDIKNEDDVLIRVKSVGVCGSDIHYYKEGRIGDFVVKEPLILGHETSGIIEKVGKKVKNLKEGERVAIEPGIPCRKCDYCKEGRYNLCPDVKFFATPPIDGTFCEYIVHPSDFVYKIPENISLDEATLIEPFSVGIHACNLVNLKPGEKVMISGLGPVGLLSLLSAKIYGGIVYGIEKNDKRIEVAKSFGCEYVFDTKKIKIKEIKNSLKEKVDVVFECSGFSGLIEETLYWVKRGGRIVFIGLGTDFVNLNVTKITNDELEIYGIFRYVNTYKKAIEIIDKNKIDLKRLISKNFSLDKVKDALEYIGKNSDCIKVIVNP